MNPDPPPVCHPVKREQRREPVNSAPKLKWTPKGRIKGGLGDKAGALSLTRGRWLVFLPDQAAPGTR